MSDEPTTRAAYDTRDVDGELRPLLREAIHRSSLSRAVIAEKLTRSLGRKVTVPMLDTWTAATKGGYHLPADAVPALCEILQDDALQRQLLSRDLREALELGESARRMELLLARTVRTAHALKGSQRRRKETDREKAEG